MPQFSYKARNPEGRVLQGQLEADTEDAARVVLRGRKFTILEITKAKSGKGFFNSGPKVKQADVVIFSRQLAVMVAAGLPVVQAIGIIGEQSESPGFKKVLLQIRDDVSSGSNITEALSKHPTVFESLYVNMVRAGEQGGNLDIILDRLSTYLEKAAALQGKISAAMMYPAAIAFVASAVVIFLMVKVIPSFKDVFSSFGAQLPLPTRILLGVSDFLQTKIVFIIGTVVGGFVGLKSFRATEGGEKMTDGILLKLPVFGPLLRKFTVARFARTLGTLMMSGVPILDGLEIVAKTAGNKVIEAAILTARLKIREGEEIAAPLKATGVFPTMVIQMMSVGQETGKLDAMLVRIADFYDGEVDVAVDGLMKLIEPVMMVVMGGTVGCIVLGMFMPMFEMSSMAGG